MKSWPNSQVVPKKGKLRRVQKKPAAPKNRIWVLTKYVREKVSVGSRGQRKDQIKWKRTLPELLKADPMRITRILVEDKILPNWAGKKCPRCGQGTLSVLVKDTDSRNQSTMYKHRCSKKVAVLESTRTIYTPFSQKGQDLRG